MSENNIHAKSCGPQHSDASTPTADWLPKQLGEYARVQHQAIVKGEKRLTPAYWRLGQALTLARRHFNSGQWGMQLEELGIDRTRASKACAIFKTFDAPEEVDELSVEEAYQQRERKQRKPSKKRGKQGGAEHPPTMKEFFAEIGKWAELLLDEADTATHKSAEELLGEVGAAIIAMKRLEAALERRMVVA